MRPIFVGNFEYDTRQSELERLFSKYGRIERVDMKSGSTSILLMENELLGSSTSLQKPLIAMENFPACLLSLYLQMASPAFSSLIISLSLTSLRGGDSFKFSCHAYHHMILEELLKSVMLCLPPHDSRGITEICLAMPSINELLSDW